MSPLTEGMLAEFGMERAKGKEKDGDRIAPLSLFFFITRSPFPTLHLSVSIPPKVFSC